MLAKFERNALNFVSRFVGNHMVVNEHFVPKLGLELEPYIQNNDMTGAHHLVRYLWAVRVLNDQMPRRSILDIASGSGYGAYMLAQHFPDAEVLGVDYDAAAIRTANQRFDHPNLSFRQGDALQWERSIGPKQFDCIISFDTLEHVPHREIFMENLIAHMHEKSVLLFSTPSGHEENVLAPRWINHSIEFSSASLYDFMHRYFGEILRPEAEPYPHLDILCQLDGSGVDYVLRMNPIICRSPLHIANPYRS